MSNSDVLLSIHKPHDKFFRAVFSEAETAESFFRGYLPERITSKFDWQTLKLDETSFVDEEFAESESDLLYQVQLKVGSEEKGRENALLYILFEHQSTVDKWMCFRLLKYMCRIWDESFKKYPKQQHLKPILPLVFYQGEDEWTPATEFRDLFAENDLDLDFVPQFSHFLVDLSGMAPEEVKGEVKAQLAQLVMKAAAEKQVQQLFDLLIGLLAQIPLTGGISFARIFIRYMAATQEKQTVLDFVDKMQKADSQVGGKMLTAAEEWFMEGKQEGMLRGKLEVIEGLLKVGVDWTMIMKATGINQEKFQQLKQEVKGMS